MAEFDAISKHLIQTYPNDFASFTLGREDIEVLAVIDTEQLTIETHQTDSLIRVRIDNEEVLVHNEFQTADSTNPPMPRRMAGYIGHAIRQHGLPIYSNVIYLRPNAGRARSRVLYPEASRLPNRDSLQGDQADRDRRRARSRIGAIGSDSFHAIDEAT